MRAVALLAAPLLAGCALARGPAADPDPLHTYRRQACPDYTDYSARKHGPYSSGPFHLPYQRPAPACRLFVSPAVDNLIDEMTAAMADPDLARLFENCFPNTLDTTVKWHTDSDANGVPQSFIITGDITAQWLRDSTNQLAQYQDLAKDDAQLRTLIKGAINTQIGFVLTSPYCNAFQPPTASGLSPTSNGQTDTVHPAYDPNAVFECKYELDSLGSFLSLGNQYYASTGDSSFVTANWLKALATVMATVEQQTISTFAWDGTAEDVTYTFQRQTNTGTETLNLAGEGNPLAMNTSLVRSAFRPSDDACILQFFIPANAFMATELAKTAQLLTAAKQPALAKQLKAKSDAMKAGIEKYGIVTHPVWGRVYAYEVDGYGGQILMDDANLPSLLALPLLGFTETSDPVYVNTKKMVLSARGNPYYIEGAEFAGVGGPHIGIRNAWPLSVLMQVQLSDDDAEILRLLKMVLGVSPFGLINESVDVDNTASYTRSWFAWANSVLAQTVLDLKKRKPHLLFNGTVPVPQGGSKKTKAKGKGKL